MAAALITAAQTSAFAATSPTATNAATATDKPAAIVYFATAYASAPYQIVSGGSIYTTNTLDATSSPPPADCQIASKLLFETSITNVNLLESEYSGYKACSALLNKGVTTPAYPCVISPGLTQFYTLGETDIITPAGNTDTSTATSSIVKLYCGA